MTDTESPRSPEPSRDGATSRGATTMHIGAVAERTGLSQRTLRHYDEVGLLRPTGRSDGGFRLYTSADVERLLLIRRMKPLGFSLEEMADLLRSVDALRRDSDDAAARQSLARYLASAQERRDTLVRTVEMADEFIDLLRAT